MLKIDTEIFSENLSQHYSYVLLNVGLDCHANFTIYTRKCVLPENNPPQAKNCRQKKYEGPELIKSKICEIGNPPLSPTIFKALFFKNDAFISSLTTIIYCGIFLSTMFTADLSPQRVIYLATVDKFSQSCSLWAM